jgi:stage II sporulation protein D
MKPRKTRNSRRRIAAYTAVSFVMFAYFVAPSEKGRADGSQDMSDSALEAASAGRTVRVRTGANGDIIDLPVELYVARVLAGEAEPRAAAAAQQALAIAIRTFAAANVGRHRRDGFDLCDSTHCQVLRPSTAASRLAALATASQLLTYEGRPALVFYSASCGGRSEAPSQVWPGAIDLPYLRASEDDVHGAEETWLVDVPVERVHQGLRRLGFEGRRLRDLDVERRSASGRVTLIRLEGLRPDVISGEDFRAAIGARELRSTQFTVRKDGAIFRFTGRGYGHGVGLCVIGAGRRAARGESATEILQRYYPGLQVEPPVAASHPLAAEPAREHGTAVAPRVGDQRAHQIAQRARIELSTALGIASAPEVRVEVYESLDAFRNATGKPWWVTFAATGPLIELAPPAILEQGDGVETSVRRAVAEILVADALTDRPAWVRVGAGRYYATTPRLGLSIQSVKCPSDAELTMAVSAPAHRDAELRAEACFARALVKARNWRDVR